MCLGDYRHIGGSYDVHGGYAVGEILCKELYLLEFCLERKICVSNTCMCYW